MSNDSGAADKTTSKNTASAGGALTKKRTWKKSLLKWTLIILVVIGAGLWTYRWAGTTTYRGTVQRVYEKESEYRVEFVDMGGKVHVAGNAEVRFPYFKLDTADLHAEMNRLAETQDVVDMKVWGFRFSWISMFPNVVEVGFVKSNADRRRKRAEAIADAVMERLMERGVLKGGDGVRPDIIEAIEGELKRPEADAKPGKKLQN